MFLELFSQVFFVNALFDAKRAGIHAGGVILGSPGRFSLKRLGQPLRFGVGMGSGVLFALRFSKCRIDSETISALFFVAVLVPLGVQFLASLEVLWYLIFVIKSLTFQSTFPGDPGHRHTAKTSENAGRVV